MSTVEGRLKNDNGDILHPETNAGKVLIKNASNQDSTVETEISTLRSDIAGLAGLDTFKKKGTVDGTHPLPASGYAIADCYLVGEAGTYAGIVCDAGDWIYCKAVSTPAANSDWAVMQGNLINALTGLDSSTDEDVICFNGTDGKRAKSTGITKTQLTTAANVGATLDDNKSELAKYNGSNGLPTYNGTAIGNGIPVVENGANAPSGLLPGALYFEKDAVAQGGGSGNGGEGQGS